MEKKIRKKAVLYGLAAVLLTTLLGTLIYNYGAFMPMLTAAAPPVAAPHNSLLSTFSSEEALKNYLISNAKFQGRYMLYGPWDSVMRPLWNGVATAGAKDFNFEHSTTNVQVANVDETDMVKTDDNGYMYVVSGTTVYILKAFPLGDAAIVSKITIENSYLYGIFVKGNRLAVLGSYYSSTYGVFPRYLYTEPMMQVTETFVNVYGIEDRAHPILLRDFTLTGSYINSRMIGDYVYFVTNKEAYVENETIYLPEIWSNGQNKTVEPTEIRYVNGTDDHYVYTTFVALNMQNTAEAPVYLPIMLGYAGNMYVSLNNMYVTFRDWGYYYNGNTTIYRIHIEGSNMTCEAKGTVPGYERNQFSMDEYNGYFRIETTTSGTVNTTWPQWVTQTNLYVLDMNLTIVGKLEGLASGENFHSARFMGDRAYFVTFKKTDPLFVIDLSNATHPTVLGELHIPGYSDYLHPYDETHLIGVGKNTVEAEEGDFAWYQGIKISLFDVSNVTNPTQMASVIIGDRGSDSPVLSDHKAFLFDKSKNLLAIPVSVAKIDPSQYPEGVPSFVMGDTVWQGSVVYDVSLDHGFQLKGNVTHMFADTYIWDVSYWVKRTLYIEDVLYTVSDKMVKMNMLTNLAPVGEILLS